MLGLLLAFTCIVVIAALMFYVDKSPRLQCLLWGHQPILHVEKCGVFKKTCAVCKQEVKRDE